MEEMLKNTLKWLLVFLFIFIPFRELIGYYTTDYIKFLPDIAIWLLFIVLVFHKKFKLSLKFYDIFFVLFIAFGFISTLINHTSILAFLLQSRSISTIYVLFYILRSIKLGKNDYKTLIKISIIPCIIITVLAVLEYMSNKYIGYPNDWAILIYSKANFARAYSILKNPNVFSIYAFFSFYLVYLGNKLEITKIPKVLYILLLLPIFIAASRSTEIVVILFVVFLFINAIIEKKYKSIINVVAIILIAVGLTFGLNTVRKMYLNPNEERYYGNVYDENGNKIISEDEEEGANSSAERWREVLDGKTFYDNSTDGRIFKLKLGFKVFKDHFIFGTGFGTFGSAGSKMVTPELYETYGISKGMYSDNEYLKIVVETGIIGTFLFGLFLLSLFKNSLNNRFKLFIFVVFLFVGLFCNIFELQVICFLLYLILTLLDSITIKR